MKRSFEVWRVQCACATVTERYLRLTISNLASGLMPATLYFPIADNIPPCSHYSISFGCTLKANANQDTYARELAVSETFRRSPR